MIFMNETERKYLEEARALLSLSLRDHPDAGRALLHLRDDIPRLLQIIESQEKRIEVMGKALEFYANKQNWMKRPGSEWQDTLIEKDCAFYSCGGGRARLALATEATENE